MHKLPVVGGAHASRRLPLPRRAPRHHQAGFLRSLRVPNYRRYTAANLVSITGTWMQMVAQSWLVMEITGSSTALGASVMLQALPSVGLGLWGGLLADRVCRRSLLMASQALHALLALAIGALAVTGTLNISVLFIATALTGVLAALEGPASSAFGAELVPRELLPNAIALGSAVSSIGRLGGMALAGAVGGVFGLTAVFFINGVSYLAVIAALASLRMSELQPAERAARAPGQLREGFREVTANRRLVITMALAFVLAAFGRSFQVTMAAMTSGPLGAGADGYALASTVFAGGALVGAVLAAKLASLSARILVVAAAAAAGAQALSGLAPHMLGFLVALTPAAIGAVVIDSAISSITQLEVSDAVRGRVLSFLGIVSMGGAALGGPMLGSLADVLGARASLVIGGTVAGAAAVLAAFAYHRLRGHVDDVPELEPITEEVVALAAA